MASKTIYAVNVYCVPCHRGWPAVLKNRTKSQTFKCRECGGNVTWKFIKKTLDTGINVS